jgi:beta-glucosidase
MKHNDFGSGFAWGAAVSAFQTEGYRIERGAGESIWDRFLHEKLINPEIQEPSRTASGSLLHYPKDISLLNDAGFGHYRFSLSWPRIMPSGKFHLNKKGIAWYHVFIDHLLKQGITPWVTLYHWDLPQELQEKGGWASRDIVHRMEEYAYVAARYFGDRVKNWMVLNEPSVFTGAGYLLGIHAPGIKKLDTYLKAAHHALLAQSAGAAVLRSHIKDANIGTALSFTDFEPLGQSRADLQAAGRLDALVNRMFLEPTLGMGIPEEARPFMERIEPWISPQDEQRMKFNFDFIGVQVYTRQIVAAAPWIPMVKARIIPPEKRSVPLTAMNWEDYPEALYHAVTRLQRNYYKLPPLVVTENGIALHDERAADGEVHDLRRIEFFSNALRGLKRAMNEGADVRGYFAWSLLDNFEWAEGIKPRFGLVHVDFNTLERTPKKSWHWWKEFLR